MLRIELMDWQRAREHAAPIRFEVFVREQNVPAEIELDEMDEKSVHAIAFEDGRAVGTGRLLPDAHIGRMAVLRAWRRRGVGAQLLQELVEKARQQGHREAVLSAQVHALAFYERHGFRAEGRPYSEAGIQHQLMRRAL